MKGFTLIEVLIYIGLFGLIMSAAFVSVVSIEGSSARNQSDAYLEEEGQFLISKIESVLQSGGESSEFVVKDGALWLARQSAPVTLLTGKEVRVESLLFSAVPVSGETPAHTEVSVVLTATSSTGAVRTQKFTTTYYDAQY